MLVNVCQLDTNLTDLGGRISAEKLSLPYCPVNAPVGYFVDYWLTGEASAHARQCCPGVGSSGLCGEGDGESHVEETSKQSSSVVCAPVPASRFLTLVPTPLLSVMDSNLQPETKSFLHKLFLSCCLIITIGKQTGTSTLLFSNTSVIFQFSFEVLWNIQHFHFSGTGPHT